MSNQPSVSPNIPTMPSVTPTGPNITNLVGQVGGIQRGINQNLGGAVGAPDITQLIQRVNAMKTTQAAAMGAPPATAPMQPAGMGVSPGMKGK